MQVTCDLNSFAERDIDVWLAEELRFNIDFCKWIFNQIDIPELPILPAYRCRVSVIDEMYRETDIEALFRLPKGGTFALLIEDKIKANFQPNQMEDYLERGQRGLTSKTWDKFGVVVFAPSYRRLSVPSSVKVLSFADASQILLDSDEADDRQRYRAAFLQQADRPTAGIAEPIDPQTINWWLSVDEMLVREFGDFFLLERQNFPKQTWINPRCFEMPPYLRLDLKGYKGEIDLAFKNVPFSSFSETVGPICPLGVKLVENEKSSALRISGLKKFSVGDGLAVIPTHVQPAYAAAKELLTFWRTHRSTFDALAFD